MKKRLIYTFNFLLILILTTSCFKEAMPGGDSAGTGGSMARFTIAGDYLYTVDDQDLKTFDISKKDKPVFVDDQNVGFGVETIFPMDSVLFLGTTTGMYIYRLDNPADPDQIAHFEHVVSCDPVVSDGEYAYVTLNSDAIRCNRGSNVLQILDLADMNNPLLIKTFDMNSPKGLAIRNDSLWVCDDGIKILDVSKVSTISELNHFKGLDSYDVILDEDRAIVVGENGLVQFQLVNGELTKLSEIKTGN